MSSTILNRFTNVKIIFCDNVDVTKKAELNHEGTVQHRQHTVQTRYGDLVVHISSQSSKKQMMRAHFSELR